MQKIEKERIEFIDLAKGICILLVVVVHVIPQLSEKFEFLGCLRMPLYFCLSGLFFKDYGGLKNFTIKKVNNILIPFMAWYVIGYAIYYLGRALMPSGDMATFHLNDVFVQNEIFNLPIWFLLCLFWSSLIFAVIESITKKWYGRFAGVMATAGLGFWLSGSGIFNFLYIGSAMTCMPFFYMGYALKRTALLYPSSGKKRDMAIMLGCVLLAGLLAFIPDLPPRLNYYRNEIVAGNFVTIYACAFFMVVALLLLTKFIRHIPFVTWLGRYSIIVLVTHMFLRDIYSTVLNRFAGENLSDDLRSVTVLLLVILSMTLIIPFCKKYLPYITAQKGIIKTDYEKKNNISINKIIEKKENNLIAVLIISVVSLCMESCNQKDEPVYPDPDFNPSIEDNIFGDQEEQEQEETILITRQTVYDPVDDMEWQYHILLPSSYEYGNEEYPVVYLLHGLNAYPSDWYAALHLKEKVEKLRAEKQIPEVIYVMPDGGKTYYVNDYDETIQYENFFIEYFIPEIESLFRIRGERSSRSIAGYSMGGYGCSYYACKYPELFGSFYSMSGVIEGKGVAQTPNVINIIKETDKNLLPQMFFEVGYSDSFYKMNQKFHKELNSLGIEHKYMEREGAHNYAFWNGCLDHYLEELNVLFYQPDSGIKQVM